MRVFEAVAACGAPKAWVAAGAIRDFVWDERFGAGFRPEAVKDVDVVFFDPSDLSPDNDKRTEAELRALAPAIPWEATNQAAVHTWYAAKFGEEVPPLTSIADAIATFPETATVVAARMGAAGDIEVLAPLGLSDLFAGIWRRNPRRVTDHEAVARLERKRPTERWPGVTVR